MGKQALCFWANAALSIDYDLEGAVCSTKVFSDVYRWLQSGGWGREPDETNEHIQTGLHTGQTSSS